jgi:hypothetical protein
VSGVGGVGLYRIDELIERHDKTFYVVSLELERKKELNKRIVIELHALFIVFFQCITYFISKQNGIY